MRGITFELKMPRYVTRVETDKNRVQGILLNLLSNAVKFSRPNEKIIIELSFREDFDLNRSDSSDSLTTWQISVRDFGIGINETDQKNLF
jgi:signal transduction histidine kinase